MLHVSNSAQTPADIQRATDEALQNLAKTEYANSSSNGAHRIIRLSISLPPVEPLRWLRAQQHDIKVYWDNREGDVEIAAVGAADVVAADMLDFDAAIQQLHHRLAGADSDVRYFGGARFGHRVDEDVTWRRFGAYRFVLPRFELARTGTQTTLACNILLRGGRSLQAGALRDEVLALTFPVMGQDGDVYPPIARSDAPDMAGWCQNVESALRLLHTGTLDKIVLARKASFEFECPLDPIALLQRLKATTRNCFHFGFQLDESLAFIGATPERLYKRAGRDFYSEAVAGTRPTGETPEETEHLGLELLASEKDQREHAFVRDGIRERLAALCQTLTVDAEPSLMRLARSQHLVSRVKGRLDDTATDADLLDRLHPTSAVGGVPTDRALTEIARLEPFDRGWYAGPIGWVASDAAEFVVGIRSGLVVGSRLALYSGAGIVTGSVPQREWDEIENKIGDFVSVLTAQEYNLAAGH